MKTRFYCFVIAVFVLSLGACSSKSKSEPQGPFADPWTVMPTAEMEQVRGYRIVRGIIHCHSPYSHDACDDEPFTEGVRNEQCFQDVRAGMCDSGQDYVFLTDHDDLFAEYEYPDVLLYDQGDRLIERGGLAVANRVVCPDGREVIVSAGTETGMMPIGLEHHVADTIPERKEIYDEVSVAAVEAFQAAGGLVFLQHTEGWDPQTIHDLPIDGIEIYNLHQNMMDNMGVALELALRLETEPETLPQVEVVIAALFQESEADMYRWALAVQDGHMPGILATDAHRNVFKNPSPDGERVDSFRRMMHWFSNYLLLPEQGEVDDRVLKEAIAHGRMFGAFDFLGYPVGFDFHARAGEETYEMGDDVPDSGTVQLSLVIPRIYRLDPELEPPEIYGRILKAHADGTWEELSRGSEDLLLEVTAGVYRAEVRMIPHHLAQWMGAEPERFIYDTVWVYSNPIYVGQ